MCVLDGAETVFRVEGGERAVVEGGEQDIAATYCIKSLTL